MKGLRYIRIALAILFLVASVLYLVTSPAFMPADRVARSVQIVPSALATSMGAILFWIVVTFALGRVYCSTVCPLGTLQDIVIRAHRTLRPGRTFRYQPAKPVRYHVLIIYLLSLIIGVAAVPFWLEPWNIMRNICSTVNPTAVEATWMHLGVGLMAGIISGIVSAGLITVCAVFTGRGFCTQICPIGTALGCFNSYTLLHIEIDPDKCINCMKCEEVCKSQCVKVVGRYVDNSRCVRCLDCIALCPTGAIRLQANRNRRATPLLTKVQGHKS